MSTVDYGDGETQGYGFDPMGNRTSNNVTSSPKYDVYGLVRANPRTASSAMGFVGGLGHLSEANTGLIYMRARYYDPSLGRFNSQDPSEHGSNWFAYCSNNPTNRTDKDGRVDDITDIYNNLEDWGVTHPFAAAFLGGLLGVYFKDFLAALPAAAVGAKEMIGMALIMAGDAMISGGRTLMGEAGVSLSVYGISSTAVSGGEALALGSAMRGAAQGLGGTSELAAGLALKSIGDFMMYS